ncbi:FAD-dependent oxidoreductase [Knoellia sp. S7-12]|uniref:FAD-dependent oxidoreductase n=1 Tax=Knoellia sp. S7-12 TaxID=3126698 RepID=UPI003366DF80
MANSPSLVASSLEADKTQAPTVVIGAGPIGLAAAAHALERGLEPLVLERGDRAAASVVSWGHVRLFSRWSELVDPAARRLLIQRGWREPAGNGYPTGAEWAAQYLQPLADALGECVQYGTTVTGVARRGRDRVVDSGRDGQPFTVHVRNADGHRARLTAGAVIDASGTWTHPNTLGSDGYPADGEQDPAIGARISYGVPNANDAEDVTRFGGKRTAVIGSGHSALTALVALAQIAASIPGTRAVWVLRRGSVGNAYGGGASDELPARGALGLRARDAVAAGQIEVVSGFRTGSIEFTDSSTISLVSEDDRRVEGLDELIGLTGFRPDHSIMSELRLRLDDRLEAPVDLAPLIDPNVHSCGTVYPHGVVELGHADQGVFIVGMKAYGRAPTFLALTGYEQVRSVVAALAGDHAAAARVELTLPETGVCGGAGLFDEAGAAQSDEEGADGCCTPTPQLVQIGAPTSIGETTSGGC